MKTPSTIALPVQGTFQTTDPLLIQSTLDLFSEGELYQGVSVKLFPNNIIFSVRTQSEPRQYCIHFSFDLCFQLLRSNLDNNKKWSITDCCSIRFDKDQKYLQFRNLKNITQLTFWRDHLCTKLNQRGFHQQFRPLRQLGKGGFATVYQVQSCENKQRYAVKAFSKQTYSEEKGRQSIVSEIEAMRAFSHPNLMKFLGVYESKNSLYMIVEYLAGGQLFDRINRSCRMKAKEIREVMQSILMGLEALHQKGYMHRDLKPENIMFRENGNSQCVIADFGLAEKVDSGQLLFVRCGTPGYVAPEIANLKDSNARYGSSCDLFSVGVIFHILLLDRPPFFGATFAETLQQNKLCKINFQSNLYKRISADELDLLKSLLCKNPKQRITATEALDHQFFKKDLPQVDNLEESPEEMLGEVTNTVKPKKQPKVKGKRHSQQTESKSPITMSKNSQRKHEGLTKQDSCLKFKMRDSKIPVKNQEKSIECIESPVDCLKIKKVRTSRFKNKVDIENNCA